MTEAIEIPVLLRSFPRLFLRPRDCFRKTQLIYRNVIRVSTLVPVRCMDRLMREQGVADKKVVCVAR